MNITLLLVSLSLASPSQEGPVFSFSWRGPINGVGGRTPGDLLIAAAAGPSSNAPLPDVFLPHGALGIVGAPGCSPAQGRECGRDLDAVSHGTDPILPAFASNSGRILFSVDSHADGAYQSMVLPTLTSEASLDDQGADVLRAPWPGHPQALDLSVPGPHTVDLDGDGALAGGGAGAVRRGLGLREPNLLTHRWPYRISDAGDDLDALDYGAGRGSSGSVYLSLAGGLLDPMDPAWAVRGPAAASTNGVSAADVLEVHPFTSGLTVYASALDLGLDRTNDDIDALALAEDGIQGFSPPHAPFAWGPGTGDMLLFSLRRGSVSIGRVDSLMGLRITEGDVLTPPPVAGGVPAIVVPAEALGLVVDRGAILPVSADLDALDIGIDEIRDCNGNGIDDRYDVSTGASFDVNNNGQPDECEDVGDPFCGCTSAATSPCGNTSEHGGCKNSTGFGAELHCLGPVTLLGNFGFFAYDLPPSTLAMLITGPGELDGGVNMGDGRLCLSHPFVSVSGYLASNPNGGLLVPPGVLDAYTASGAGIPVVGMTLRFQLLYRDPLGPCGMVVNTTNGLGVTFE